MWIKIKAIWKLIWAATLKEFRRMWMQNHTFIGRYLDIQIDSKQFFVGRDVIIIGEHWTHKVSGHRKIKQRIVFYVNNNYFTRLLGYRKGVIHYALK